MGTGSPDDGASSSSSSSAAPGPRTSTTKNSNVMVQQGASSSAAAATSSSNTNNAPGGLLSYFINRKTAHQSNNNNVTPFGTNTNNNDPNNNVATNEDAATSNRNRRSSTKRYHEMVKVSSMGALLDDYNSDSDDDNAAVAASAATSRNRFETAAKEAAAGASSSSSSWLASAFQRGDQSVTTLSSSLPSNANASHQQAPAVHAASESSSWVSQAWQSVGDSAKEWVFATSSISSPSSSSLPSIDDGGGDSANSWMNMSSMQSTLSTAVSNTVTSISSLNPFASEDGSSTSSLLFANTINANDNNNSASSSSSLSNTNSNNNSSTPPFLPKFASRFEWWATKQRNPYQAVIGRSDADYLTSPTAMNGVWNLFSLTSWLPWIANLSNSHNHQLTMVGGDGNGGTGGEGGSNGTNGGTMSSTTNSNNTNTLTEEEGQQRKTMIQQAMTRKKSQPSEASVQAVRNLLFLVQQQVALEQERYEQSATLVLEQGIGKDEREGQERILVEQKMDEDEPETQTTTAVASPFTSPTSSSSSPQQSPVALPTLSTPNPLNSATPRTYQTPHDSITTNVPTFPDLNMEGDPRSFDSEPSYYDPSIVQNSPVRRASPRPTPGAPVATPKEANTSSTTASAMYTSPSESVQTKNSDIFSPEIQNTPARHRRPIVPTKSTTTDDDAIDTKSGNRGDTTMFSPVSKRPGRATIIDHRGAVMDHTTSGWSSSDTIVASTTHNHMVTSASYGNKNQAMHAEMAARLAEGTLRAYRDLALDEATELHSALHHWTIRWERPFLGWLEAGPYVWFSERGYSPYLAGKKVSQIQAVLARRCAVIGEIQQHLWRANWQKGVAGWGMLGGGIGGEWTSVVGEFGGIEVANNSGSVSSSTAKKQTCQRKQKLMKIFNHSSLVGTNVSNSPGGSIVVDENALTTWSIDAIRVIRDQLYRTIPTNQGVKELPYVDHWPRERSHFRDDGDEIDVNEMDLPLWAEEVSQSNNSAISDAAQAAAAAVNGTNINSNNNNASVVISDLKQMSNEVSALLSSIEIHLEQQRVRRLKRLRPPSRLRRNWYMIALGVPTGAVVIHKLTKEHGGFYLIKTLFSKIADIYREHVSEPLSSIYQELFTKAGRVDVTDRKARIEAIESLKRMLRSWLEEYFPTMPLEEQIQRSETMDISLLEEKMEESIKHIYELNSVIRMSLIEMQFIKKELLSALVAMDELMGSNEINMQIAAMTPALILLVTIRRAFRVLFYAFFQVGKSKEEIYSSFRQTILDIERLLLMRDNPPAPPSSLEWGSSRGSTSTAEEYQAPQTLSAEDLGMLLLHIHECRNILWQSRRRFRSDVLRNVAEDLAELAGERGSVSVSQQLQIISRMSRTYPFMKVMSSSVPFEMIIPGS